MTRFAPGRPGAWWQAHRRAQAARWLGIDDLTELEAADVRSMRRRALPRRVVFDQVMSMRAWRNRTPWRAPQ